MSGSAGAQFRLGAIKRLSRHVDRGREPVGESKVRKERECRLLHGHVNVTKAVGLFDHAHDHVHVELHTIAVRPRIDALKTGRLDIGFVRPPVNDAALTGEVLLREPFVAAPPVRHRLVKKKSVRCPPSPASRSFCRRDKPFPCTMTLS